MTEAFYDLRVKAEAAKLEMFALLPRSEITTPEVLAQYNAAVERWEHLENQGSFEAAREALG